MEEVFKTLWKISFMAFMVFHYIGFDPNSAHAPAGTFAPLFVMVICTFARGYYNSKL